MRLGCTLFTAQTPGQLEELAEKFDWYGLSAITAPKGLENFSTDEAVAFGEKARSLGIVIGEAGFWENLLTQDKEMRDDRITRMRRAMRNADLMGVRSINTLVGTRHASDRPLFPHPYNFTKDCRAEFREVVLRVLDGMETKTTRYGVEPWYTSFFYQPEDIRAFIDSVDHPLFGLHLDQANMISHGCFYDTASLIEKSVPLLYRFAVSVHVKDLQWEGQHFGLRWNEVPIGEGVFDLDLYLCKVAEELDPDITVYCEHFAEERDYALNFARLHHIAKRNGLRFLSREDARSDS